MELLYWFEKIRLPGLNEFMLLITQLGEETAFLVAALILFWCVDKKQGYYLMSVGFLGTLANQFLKLCFRVPRPWVMDPNFTILEQAREAATGYSFPSGHTQSAIGTFGLIAYSFQNKLVRYSALAIAILVPLSRMYIGVHTPLDVFVSVNLFEFQLATNISAVGVPIAPTTYDSPFASLYPSVFAKSLHIFSSKKYDTHFPFVFAV